MRTGGSLRSVATALAVAMGALFFLQAPTAAAQTMQFTIGDVFAGVGNGHINEYRPDGTFVQQLDTLSGSSDETGMCFDGNTATSNLRSTNFQDNSMSRIPQTGTVEYPWGSGFNASPESCLVTIDPATLETVVYVGQADGSGDVLKFKLDGSPSTPPSSYDVAPENRGSDWIDLAADLCTLYYTSEGFSVKRFDVCTNDQLADFATLPPLGECYALRILASGEVLVACSQNVYRLSTAGVIVMTYPKPAAEPDYSFLFALNVDPNGTSFWTAGYSTGNIYHYDITSGVIINSFTATLDGPTLAGLAVFGEPVVSLPGTMEKSTPGKGSGGGYIDSITGNLVGLATMLIQSGSPGVHLNSKATLGFIEQFKTGDASPTGNLTYNDHDANVTVKVSDWSLLSIRPSTAAECPTVAGLHATLRGMGTMNDSPGHSVRVEVDDCGEPGSGTMPDRFEIHVDEQTGYTAAGPLIGGNIQVKTS